MSSEPQLPMFLHLLARNPDAMHRSLALLTFVCLVLTPAATLAAEYGEPYLLDGARGVSGSVRWETLRQAAYTNAHVFGAVGAYERYFRPIVQDPSREDDAFFVFAEEMYFTSRIASAPVYCQGLVSASCEDTVAEFSFDQFSGGFAMGGGTKT